MRKWHESSLSCTDWHMGFSCKRLSVRGTVVAWAEFGDGLWPSLAEADRTGVRSDKSKAQAMKPYEPR